MRASTTKNQLRDVGRGGGYLPAERSGVPWMFDPEDPILQHYADHQAEGPNAPADHRYYIDDASALKHLLRQRHVAVALDPRKARITDDVVDHWVRQLSYAKPTTSAGCAGTLGKELGTALNDAHLHVRHGEHHGAVKDSLGEDVGTAWETSTINGIRTIRIRTLDGSDDVETVLRAGAANHTEDFAYQHIIVDLRGNGGGDDSYIVDWFSPHVGEPAPPACTELGMTLSSSGSSTAFWNYATWLRLNHHTVPDLFQAESLRPSQKDNIEIRRHPGPTEPFSVGSTCGASEPWEGKMIVVIDGGTGSSAESTALLLRHHMGAVLVGSPSYGVIDYGNSTPYYLPTSGLEIHLPAQANDWGASIDFAGIQPEVPIPAATPLYEIVTDFDDLHRTGTAARHRGVV